MYIKLNFSNPQPVQVFFDAIYWIMANSASWTSPYGSTNAQTFATSVSGYSTVPSLDISILKTAVSTLDITNSEIINLTTGNMPVVYCYAGTGPVSGVQDANATITFKSVINDATGTVSYTQIGVSTFQHSTGASVSWSTNTRSGGLGSPYNGTSVSLSTGNPTTAQSWNNSNTYYSFWMYISPTCITWALGKPGTGQTKSGWNMSSLSSDWVVGNNRQYGPFMVSQYTRLDVWNTDANGIIPVCYINGIDGTSRNYYGMSYAYDIGWGNLVNAYGFNPAVTGTSSNTTFSVHNTVNATPNNAGTSFSTTVGGVRVGFGTNIRSFQDHTSLATSTNNATSTTSAYTFTNGASTGAYSYFLKTSQVDTQTISAWHGIQGASLWPNTMVGPNVSDTGPPVTTTYYRWPSASTNPVGSYSLQPMLWNRVDYNNIGGLISDKAGVYLFNGDYIAGDEFTTGGIVYSIWPLADGFSNRVGLAVPKR
jgi:hypothetical protein